MFENLFVLCGYLMFYIFFPNFYDRMTKNAHLNSIVNDKFRRTRYMAHIRFANSTDGHRDWFFDSSSTLWDKFAKWKEGEEIESEKEYTELWEWEQARFIWELIEHD